MKGIIIVSAAANRHTMNAVTGMELHLHAFYILSLDGSEMSDRTPAALSQGKESRVPASAAGARRRSGGGDQEKVRCLFRVSKVGLAFRSH
jgi:hypothetical protein